MSTHSFPTLRITAESLTPEGAFAVAQAEYLHPDPRTLTELASLCATKKVGVVAHFYMDSELQGVLSSCPWDQIVIADSLKMADAAVKMAEDGVETVVVLGVDFMSENARAVLDAAGHETVEVYRLAEAEIGCSLAESAEGAAYEAWLAQAAATPRSLHVVYINTSLHTKAKAHSMVPTITCTSSNVVKTILTAADQIPGLHVWYGPDTYMGTNLITLFNQLIVLGDTAIQELHPGHTTATLKALLSRFHVFDQGNCVVHHMFGAEVVARVQRAYPRAYYTAHLEVPGEMFDLAVAAAAEGRGVVGSTSNILGFITDIVTSKLATGSDTPLQFVLGTEAGMATAIVKKVQALLRSVDQRELEVQIVFPVAAEAVAEAPESGLGILPGVAAGEGCSTAGGCATCPYMKMNSLDALFEVIEAVGTPAEARLATFRPKKYQQKIAGRTTADLGSEPILHMRHFQTHGALSDALCADVERR